MVIISIIGCVLLAEFVVGVNFPYPSLYVILLMISFISMVNFPLILNLIQELDSLTIRNTKTEEMIFSLKAKLFMLVSSVFSGTILMFITLITISHVAISMGRILPFGHLTTFIIAGIIGLVIVFYLLHQLLKYIISPLTAMVQFYKKGSEGDFREYLEVQSTDKIGCVAQMTNILYNGLNEGLLLLQKR